MKKRTEKEKSTGTSRRSVLQAATVAAIGMMLDPLSEAQPAPAPVDYGQGQGQTHLGPTNLFPLVAAWVLLTTNSRGSVDAATLQSVANLSPASAQAVYQKFTLPENQRAFMVVRKAFGQLAQDFSVPGDIYSGGECPERPEVIKPIASVRRPVPARANK